MGPALGAGLLTPPPAGPKVSCPSALAAGCAAAALLLGWGAVANAQVPTTRFGEVGPRDVREMYDRGLQYLAKTQSDRGDWQGGMQGPGITGMAVMVFVASGEDPNFGPYSNHVRKALRSIISSQNDQTGILGDTVGRSMYHHGFAMLGLAEAYGAVDERNLWPDGKGPRTIGQAGRIDGMTPAALTLLVAHVRRNRRSVTATRACPSCAH